MYTVYLRCGWEKQERCNFSSFAAKMCPFGNILAFGKLSALVIRIECHALKESRPDFTEWWLGKCLSQKAPVLVRLLDFMVLYY